MGTLRNKVERFLRGETWLHFVTMFFIQIMIMQICLLVFKIYLPTYFCLALPFVFGLSKELLDKYEGKFVSITDIAGTVVGGFLAILILRL